MAGGKLLLISLFMGAFATLVAYAAAGPAFGGGALEVSIAIGGLAFYLTASAPRRMLYGQRVAQARDAVLLKEAASSLVIATGSRAKALLALRSRDSGVESYLEKARRGVLLGGSVDEIARSSASAMASYSAAAVFLGLADLNHPTTGSESEEVSGLAAASSLSRETKLPVFMTVCFFMPVVITLYSSFARVSAPLALVGLVIVQAIILDLTFQLCSGERARS